MYKQTLCVTLPISAAVIIAAALLANAGDLDPPKGDITPTMHTLEEIYAATAAEQPCPPCTWEHLYASLNAGQNMQVLTGAGVLHGIWISQHSNITINLHDRVLPDGGPQMGQSHF